MSNICPISNGRGQLDSVSISVRNGDKTRSSTSIASGVRQAVKMPKKIRLTAKTSLEGNSILTIANRLAISNQRVLRGECVRILCISSCGGHHFAKVLDGARQPIF